MASLRALPQAAPISLDATPKNVRQRGDQLPLANMWQASSAQLCLVGIWPWPCGFRSTFTNFQTLFMSVSSLGKADPHPPHHSTHPPPKIPDPNHRADALPVALDVLSWPSQFHKACRGMPLLCFAGLAWRTGGRLCGFAGVCLVMVEG